MKQYTYHSEVRTLMSHFINACNDIKIKRFDADGAVEDTIDVIFKYGPRQRVFHDLTQQKTNIKLPLVNVYVTGITRNEQRVANNVSTLPFDTNPTSSIFLNIGAPVPIDIGINMTIITKYQRDMEQILTNWIPYFDPYINVSWNHPITNQELQSRIIWSGSAPIQSPDNLAGNTPFQWVCDTAFTMEGWLFKNDLPPAKKIIFINTSWTPVPQIFCNLEDNEAYQTTDNTDCLSLTGLPAPMIPSVDCIVGGQWTTITLFGRMFKDVVGVYVSGGPGVTVPSATGWNLFAVASSLSALVATCSAITAYAVPDFIVGNVQTVADARMTGYMKDFQQVLNESTVYRGGAINDRDTAWNMLTFHVPPLSGNGYVDFVVINAGGCSSLASSSFLHLVNPYPEDDYKHDTWEGQQYPWYGVGIPVASQ
jgi:hypothetical protein